MSDAPRAGAAAGHPARPAAPPGPQAPPPGCPVHGTGGVPRLYGPHVTADPAGVYDRLRAEHGAVAPVLLEGDVPAWLVLGYREILHVARNPHRFRRDGRTWREWREGRVRQDSPVAPVLAWGPDCTHQDGAAHQRLRRALNESLERFDRRGMRRHVIYVAHKLADGFCRSGQAELLGQFAQQLPMLVLTNLFGLPEEEGPGLVMASRQLLMGTEKALDADAAIRRVLGRLVARKHERPGHDLTSWLIAHPHDLSDEEVTHHLRLVLVAANESTTNLIGSTLRMVLTHDSFHGTLRGGRMTLLSALEQVLWDEPPIAVCPGGFAAYDMELAGRTILKGDAVLLGLAAGNTDPGVRPAPGALMHTNRSHLSFTSGPHECPGQDLGKAIAHTGIEVLLSRLPDLQLAVRPDELRWNASTWSRQLMALPVRFTPREPVAPAGPPAPRGPAAAAPPRERPAARDRATAPAPPATPGRGRHATRLTWRERLRAVRQRVRRRPG
ncbi:cytochrome P450 [Streptomyces sp. 7-21]|uniref:cytochrome P450 n=1 Tax=Streptomyces sp. 7-21 TaxID=2802283 RepID=UPI00191EA254|nr:cytochrome P450 [Streptomyces sp. 7-21]MBL1066663.1 cytochrome P450 [Streptomyces sp. 7-21]